MERVCPCGRTFTAQRSTAKFCSSTCRANSHTGRLTRITPDRSVGGESALVTATRAQLDAIDRADTPLGLTALELADRVSDRATPPAALAVLAKQLEATLASASKGVAIAGALDDLRKRRDAKRDRSFTG